MAVKKSITYVKLDDIQPDPHQPRVKFDAIRLKDLARSISKHGILSPLVVEKQNDGTLLLVDGERRYRASKIAGITEVPVIIQPKVEETQRLVEQFHIQEQHEGWTATEKAMAAGVLANQLKISIKELAEVLNLSEHSVGDYIAFSKLFAKDAFMKSEIPLHHARTINNLINSIKNVYRNHLDEPFDQQTQREYEEVIVNLMRTGKIQRAVEISRIGDVLRVQPELVKELLKKNFSPQKFYKETGVEASTLYRQTLNNARLMNMLITRGMEINYHTVFNEIKKDNSQLKTLYRNLTNLLEQLDA